MREVLLSEVCALLRSGGAGLACDSRNVRPGDVFVAIPGTRVDGAQYIPQAVRAGAVAVVARAVPPDMAGAGALFVRSGQPVRDLGALARARYGTDALPFPLFGVTGTNGKTTVTYLLEHLFRSLGRKTGVLGTISHRWPGHERDASMTTPDALDIHAMLALMREAGTQAAVMEVSSHALDQGRVEGLDFAGALFTNLSRDHLDYHADMDAYFAAKARLFQTGLRPGAPAVINGGDAYGRRLLVGLTDVFGYCLRHKLPGGSYPAADWLVGEVLAEAPDGMRLELRWKEARRVMAAPLIGAFNAENLLAVVALGLGLGMTLEQMDCFGDFPGVPGRLERIGGAPEGRTPYVFVDFAHTPDALHNVLQTLKDVGFSRIITVFGCGGDRDRAKRPLMGEAVARFSDMAVLTSDNPRHEDPLAIMGDALPGLKSGRALRIETEPDRRAAIALALDAARPGDAVLIAGKGHEKTQQIGDVKHPFSDQRIVRELLTCA